MAAFRHIEGHELLVDALDVAHGKVQPASKATNVAGADSVREIGRTRRDDAPDATFLMPIKNKGARGAG